MASNKDILTIGAIAISLLTGGDIFTGFLPKRHFKRASIVVSFIDKIACKVSRICKWIQNFGNDQWAEMTDEQKLSELRKTLKRAAGYYDKLSREKRDQIIKTEKASTISQAMEKAENDKL